LTLGLHEGALAYTTYLLRPIPAGPDSLMGYQDTLGCSTGLEPAKTRFTVWRFDHLSHEHSG
jgi:hypothetical protein